MRKRAWEGTCNVLGIETMCGPRRRTCQGIQHVFAVQHAKVAIIKTPAF